MIVARPVGSEPDLLTGNERCVLRFVTSNAKQELATVNPPQDGWTHAALDAITRPTGESWDAFLGAQWIGSSEI